MPFLILTLISALLISSVVGFFSVAGLVAIFPDALVPIICLGVALEAAKLITASFVYRHWNTSKMLARGYLLIAVIVLSCITSVGVYGYLSKTNLAGNAQIGTGQDKIAFVQKSIDAQVGNIKAESTALAQMSAVMNNYLLDTAKVATAEKVRNNQAKERQRSKDKIAKANSTILSLQLQKDSLSGIQRVNEIHVGPLKYLAELFGMSAEKMVRWFILVIVFVADPLAICLVLAANAQSQELKSPKTPKTTKEPPIDTKNDETRPIQRLYEPKTTKDSLEWVERNNKRQRERIEANVSEPSKLDEINSRMMETMDDTHDFGFTDPPSRPIIQVIHP